MMITLIESAPRTQFAKNQTPYIVENQWYSRLFTQKIAAKVSVSAAIGSPRAAVLRLMIVHFASPSVSCVNEALRSRAESQIQHRKNTIVAPVNTGRFSSTAFFS